MNICHILSDLSAGAYAENAYWVPLMTMHSRDAMNTR